MNKTLSIARTEFIKHLRKPTFWLTLFGIPLLAAVISLFSGDAAEETKGIPGLVSPEQIAAEIEAGKAQIGFVDLSGRVPAIPASFPETTAALYRRYATVDEAQAALKAGDIPAFYIIPADYIAKGELIRYSPQFNPFGNNFQESLIETLLATSLLESGDVRYARAILEPSALISVDSLSKPSGEDAQR